MTDAGLRPVYSLRVDTADHSFLTDGFVSHNTEARLAKLAEEMLSRARLEHGRLRAELRRVEAGAARPAGAVPEPARERVGRDRGRHGDEHAAAPPRRDGRRRGRADRQPRRERRGPDEARQGPRLPDRRDHRRPLGDPRRLSHRPRPRRHARSRPHRGAPRRQERDRGHRASLRHQEGRGQRRDQEDRRPRTREGDHRGLGPRRPQRPHRHADPDRAEARRHTAGGAEQALQAHRRSRPTFGYNAVALVDGVPRTLSLLELRHALPGLPARDRHAPLRARASPGRAPRPHPPRLPDRARQPRRRDRADPRLERHRVGRARG